MNQNTVYKGLAFIAIAFLFFGLAKSCSNSEQKRLEYKVHGPGVLDSLYTRSIPSEPDNMEIEVVDFIILGDTIKTKDVWSYTDFHNPQKLFKAGDTVYLTAPKYSRAYLSSKPIPKDTIKTILKQRNIDLIIVLLIFSGISALISIVYIIITFKKPKKALK